MRNQVVEYTVVKAGNASSLEKRVNELIHQGWQPQGGLDFEKNIGMRQAMVKLKRQTEDKSA